MSWDVLRRSSGRLLEDVLSMSWKKVVATSISDQSKTSLRPNLRRFHDIFATSWYRLGYSTMHKYDMICLSKTYVELLLLIDDSNILIAGDKMIHSDHPSNNKKRYLSNICHLKWNWKASLIPTLCRCLTVSAKHYIDLIILLQALKSYSKTLQKYLQY